MKAERAVLGICLLILAATLCAAQWIPVAEVSSYEPSFPFVFVLDAGHGGEDGGASSDSGQKESDINLGIVLRLDQLMGFCGRTTVLTRSDDRSIHDASADTIREKKVSDLHNRVKLVEETEHAVLVSVHQNSYTDSRYSGAQVFYGGAAGSQLWGAAAQEVLRLALNPENTRAAKAIPDTVYLMNHITCPAILVECGFLSNREEALRLATEEYQKKLAAALTGVCLQIETITDIS